MSWHLAIETSGREASLALFRDSDLVQWKDLNSQSPTTASIGVALDQMFHQIRGSGSAGAAQSSLELITVVDGPGSFTGLRIGVTMAKTLCYATGAQLVCVDALAVICAQIRAKLLESDQTSRFDSIHVATNAHRGQLFTRKEPTSALGSENGAFETKLMDLPEWQEQEAAPGTLAVAKCGEPQLAYPTTRDGWPRPMAETAGRIGAKLYESGKTVDFWSLVPRYLRKSAAEEKAEAKRTSSFPPD